MNDLMSLIVDELPGPRSDAVSPIASGPFQPLNLTALYAMPLPTVEYLVDGLLPRGTLVLNYAREKSGKGLIAIDLLASIATGEPFLDRAVTQGAVVYCAAEEDIREVRARVMRRMGDRVDTPFYVLPLDGSTADRLRLDIPETLARLEAMIEELVPEAIVLDVLRELHDAKEDVSDEMARVMRPLREMAHRHETTIIVNHHMAKSGVFRGSTAILASCDVGWSFERSDDESPVPKGTLTVDGRSVPKMKLTIQFSSETGRWQSTTAVEIHESGLRGRILRELDAVYGRVLSASDLTDALESVALKSIQNELTAMKREVPPPFAVSGAGRRGDPQRYSALNPRLDLDYSSLPSPLGSQEGGIILDSSGNDPGTNGNLQSIRVPTCLACGDELEEGRNYRCRACAAGEHGDEATP